MGLYLNVETLTPNHLNKRQPQAVIPFLGTNSGVFFGEKTVFFSSQ